MKRFVRFIDEGTTRRIPSNKSKFIPNRFEERTIDPMERINIDTSVDRAAYDVMKASDINDNRLYDLGDNRLYDLESKTIHDLRDNELYKSVASQDYESVANKLPELSNFQQGDILSYIDEHWSKGRKAALYDNLVKNGNEDVLRSISALSNDANKYKVMKEATEGKVINDLDNSRQIPNELSKDTFDNNTDKFNMKRAANIKYKRQHNRINDLSGKYNKGELSDKELGNLGNYFDKESNRLGKAKYIGNRKYYVEPNREYILGDPTVEEAMIVDKMSEGRDKIKAKEKLKYKREKRKELQDVFNDNAYYDPEHIDIDEVNRLRSDALEEKLEELRTNWIEAKRNGDTETMSKIEQLGKSLKDRLDRVGKPNNYDQPLADIIESNRGFNLEGLDGFDFSDKGY